MNKITYQQIIAISSIILCGVSFPTANAQEVKDLGDDYTKDKNFVFKEY